MDLDFYTLENAPTPRIETKAHPGLDDLPSEAELLSMLGRLSELLDPLHCASAYQIWQPADLPDPWDDDLVSQRSLLRRLFRYAGEDDESVPVVLIDEREARARSLGDKFDGELIYHDSVDAQAQFVLMRQGDLRAMVGPSCLEVARAIVHRARLEALPAGYRSDHQAENVELPDDLEAFLACYLLGFGIPVTNACFDQRHESEIVGSSLRGARLAQSIDFPPDLAAWVLAVIYRAQGRSAAYVNTRTEVLNSNQADSLVAHFAAQAEWEGGVERLRATLRWPAPATWPEEQGPSHEELSADELDLQLAATEAERRQAIVKPNHGQPVFRVRPHKARWGGVSGMVIGLVAGAFITPGLAVALWVGAGIALGSWIGRRVRGSMCSDPNCQAGMGDAKSGVCPSCGGTIVGELESADDRLAALEELESAENIASNLRSRGSWAVDQLSAAK